MYVNQGAEAGGNSTNPKIDTAVNGRIQNKNLDGTGYEGGWIGNRTTNPGHVQHQMVVAGEVLARYGDAADKSAGAGVAPAFAPVAELYLSAPGSALHEGNADPVAHTVVQGETLQSIARSTLGDSRLWYRIAQANGLSVQPDAPLQAGLTLSIPKATLSANSASTFKPYDPSRVIGDANPALNALPQPQGGGGDDCGGFGPILLIAIAIAVTIITQGATSELVAEAVFEAAAAEGATAATVSTTLTAAKAASVVAAAVAGNLASQVAGNALGLQDGFNWQSVALAAVSAGVSGGLSGVDFTGGAINGLGNTIVRSAVGSALTQGVSVAIGLQRSFSWTNVAASAIGAGVGYGANEALGLTSNGIATNTFSGADRFGRATLSSLASSTATALAHGGRVSITQIAVNAFGQALGGSLAEQAMMGGTQEDRLGGFIEQNQPAWEQRQAYNDQIVGAFNQDYSGNRQPGVRMAYLGNGSELGGVNFSGDRLATMYLDPQVTARGRTSQGLPYEDFDTGARATGVLQANVTGQPLEALESLAVQGTGLRYNPFTDSSLLGGTAGVAASFGNMALGAARLGSNTLMQVGNILTGGYNNDHPLMQQVLAEQRALGEGIFNAVTSPLATINSLAGSVVTRYDNAMAQGNDFDRSYELGKLVNDVGQGAIGLGAVARGVVRLGASGVNSFGAVSNEISTTNGINFNARPTGVPYEGMVYRLENPARVETTFDVHAGNVASDHRYSGPGYGAVYGGTSAETAFAEVDHYGVAAGRVSISKNINIQNVLDLTNLEVRQQLNIDLEQITGNSYSVTQQVGNFARQNGYSGILAPSARNPGGSNLVIFPKVKQ